LDRSLNARGAVGARCLTLLIGEGRGTAGESPHLLNAVHTGPSHHLECLWTDAAQPVKSTPTRQHLRVVFCHICRKLLPHRAAEHRFPPRLRKIAFFVTPPSDPGHFYFSFFYVIVKKMSSRPYECLLRAWGV
jgi:hypothetical protein